MIKRRRRTLDVIIANFVKDIKLMDKNILNILRVAIYQMNFLDKIPTYAACNEAIEEANKKVLEENGRKALQYATTEGFNPLRKWIAES